MAGRARPLHLVAVALLLCAGTLAPAGSGAVPAELGRCVGDGGRCSFAAYVADYLLLQDVVVHGGTLDAESDGAFSGSVDIVAREVWWQSLRFSHVHCDSVAGALVCAPVPYPPATGSSPFLTGYVEVEAWATTTSGTWAAVLRASPATGAR